MSFRALAGETILSDSFALFVTQRILTNARYRAPKSTRGGTDADMVATGFLDGDFIEQFLSLVGSKEIVDKVMAGTSDPEKLKVKVEDLQKVVESLQSMH
jgi:DNA damage-binding protein 1